MTPSPDKTIVDFPTPAPQEPIRTKIYWKLRRQALFLQQRWFRVLSFLLLDNKSGGAARASLLRWNGARVGKNCFVRGDLTIQDWFFNLTLGDDVFINSACLIDTSAPISIGNRAEIGYQVTLITGDHEIGSRDHRAGERAPKPIVVGQGAWIGARAVIFPGVTVGEGAVVASAATVTTNVAPNTVVAGSPARLIKRLDAEEPV